MQANGKEPGELKYHTDLDKECRCDRIFCLHRDIEKVHFIMTDHFAFVATNHFMFVATRKKIYFVAT